MKKRPRSPAVWLVRVLGIAIVCGVVWLSPRLYTIHQLRVARAAGVYPSVEEGMRDLIAKHYIAPDHTWIVGAGPNDDTGRNPHVWFVTACVCGGQRVDGSPTGNYRGDCDMPGTFYLNTKEGWVQMGEGAFPGLIGGWMKELDLAGPGSSQPTHGSSTPSMRPYRCTH